jgi:hypothetical protein
VLVVERFPHWTDTHVAIRIAKLLSLAVTPWHLGLASREPPRYSYFNNIARVYYVAQCGPRGRINFQSGGNSQDLAKAAGFLDGLHLHVLPLSHELLEIMSP